MGQSDANHESGALDALRLERPLACWHESRHSARTDRMVSLSEFGGFIETDRPVPSGADVFLELHLGHASNAAKGEIDALVVAQGNGAAGAAGFEVQFLDLDDAVRTWIRHHLGAMNRSGSVHPRELAIAAKARGEVPEGFSVPPSLEGDAVASASDEGFSIEHPNTLEYTETQAQQAEAMAIIAAPAAVPAKAPVATASPPAPAQPPGGVVGHTAEVAETTQRRFAAPRPAPDTEAPHALSPDETGPRLPSPVGPSIPAPVGEKHAAAAPRAPHLEEGLEREHEENNREESAEQVAAPLPAAARRPPQDDDVEETRPFVVAPGPSRIPAPLPIRVADAEDVPRSDEGIDVEFSIDDGAPVAEVTDPDLEVVVAGPAPTLPAEVPVDSRLGGPTQHLAGPNPLAPGPAEDRPPSGEAGAPDEVAPTPVSDDGPSLSRPLPVSTPEAAPLPIGAAPAAIVAEVADSADDLVALEVDFSGEDEPTEASGPPDVSLGQVLFGDLSAGGPQGAEPIDIDATEEADSPLAALEAAFTAPDAVPISAEEVMASPPPPARSPLEPPAGVDDDDEPAIELDGFDIEEAPAAEATVPAQGPLLGTPTDQLLGAPMPSPSQVPADAIRETQPFGIDARDLQRHLSSPGSPAAVGPAPATAPSPSATPPMGTRSPMAPEAAPGATQPIWPSRAADAPTASLPAAAAPTAPAPLPAAPSPTAPSPTAPTPAAVPPPAVPLPSAASAPGSSARRTLQFSAAAVKAELERSTQPTLAAASTLTPASPSGAVGPARSSTAQQFPAVNPFLASPAKPSAPTPAGPAAATSSRTPTDQQFPAVSASAGPAGAPRAPNPLLDPPAPAAGAPSAAAATESQPSPAAAPSASPDQEAAVQLKVPEAGGGQSAITVDTSLFAEPSKELNPFDEWSVRENKAEDELPVIVGTDSAGRAKEGWVAAANPFLKSDD